MQTDSIYVGDCLDVLKDFPDECIHAVITDPPYFIHGLQNNKWEDKNITKSSTVSSLSSGMKFDRKQSEQLYDWYGLVSKELLRVLKPGGFFFSFSSPRLYHSIAMAVEDAGFDIKDQFIWLYTQNQAKAMGMDHIIDRLDVTGQEKENLKKHLSGWKTPQVKTCHEPIVMAQKPPDGTFLENYRKNGCGLVNTNVKMSEQMFPSNVALTEQFDILDRYFLVPKPTKKEKGEYNFHLTAKPISLCQYLIALTTREGDLILDPFVGSGTTIIAAKDMNRKYVGIELNEEYVELIFKRLKNAIRNCQ